MLIIKIIFYTELTENNKKQLYYLTIHTSGGKNFIMQKDELIQLHTLLLQIKTHLEEICGNNGCDFLEYSELDVTPHQIYKSKREHKLAVFTLGKEIATFLASDQYSGLGKVSTRLDQMAEKFKNNSSSAC